MKKQMIYVNKFTGCVTYICDGVITAKVAHFDKSIFNEKIQQDARINR